MKKFWQQVNNAVVGGLTVLVLLIINLLWWIFDAQILVPLWVLSVVIIVCYMICIIVYGVCSIKQGSTVYRLPKVKSIQKSGNKCILIVERNDLFNQGSYATIGYQDDDNSLETILGLGYVESINSAGNLQIDIYIFPNAPNAKDIFEKLDNTYRCRSAIKVKPSLHKDILKEVAQNG